MLVAIIVDVISIILILIFNKIDFCIHSPSHLHTNPHICHSIHVKMVLLCNLIINQPGSVESIHEHQ